MRYVLAALLLLGASTAQAADRYLDDRSTAESLIRSLYSAINLHQYSRAYTYYTDPPAKDYDTYTKGFDNTAHVDVLVGNASGDGAAGHTYYAVPVAIRARDAAGKPSYFAGCYLVVQINADQDPPYRPLQIRNAKLKPVKPQAYAPKSLPKCTDFSQ